MNNLYLTILFIFSLFIGQLQISAQNQKNIFQLVPGNIIHHTPASSGVYVGAPSITSTPSGDYFVSLNFTEIQGGDHGNVHKTAIYKSANKGQTWNFVTDIENQRWSTIFLHNGDLYLIGVYQGFGNAVIRKSIDKGKSWTDPVNKENGLLAEGRYHCAPVPVLIHNGKIWRAMEDAPKGREFRAFIMSANINSDLLKADNWTFSNKLNYDSSWFKGNFRGWLEGNVVLTKERNIVNILRCSFSDGTHSKAAIVNYCSGSEEVSFDSEKDFINLPGGTKKFTIRFDSISNKYWSLVNWIQPGDMKYLENGNMRAGRIRNTLALASSTNLQDWIIERIVLYHPDINNHAFQYVDWQFENEDIIAVSRTAYEDGMGGADNYHNANFITFHRIKQFRNNFNKK
jgi:hypothetical protein